jgi:hypothetical protein
MVVYFVDIYIVVVVVVDYNLMFVVDELALVSCK